MTKAYRSIPVDEVAASVSAERKAKIAARACEQKSRKFKGTGWWIEHEFLSSNFLEVQLAFDTLKQCCCTVTKYILIGTNGHKEATLRHIMFGQSFVTCEDACRFAAGFDASNGLVNNSQNIGVFRVT